MAGKSQMFHLPSKPARKKIKTYTFVSLNPWEGYEANPLRSYFLKLETRR